MSPAPPRRPSWSGCLSPRAACCLATTRGEEFESRGRILSGTTDGGRWTTVANLCQHHQRHPRHGLVQERLQLGASRRGPKSHHVDTRGVAHRRHAQRRDSARRPPRRAVRRSMGAPVCPHRRNRRVLHRCHTPGVRRKRGDTHGGKVCAVRSIRDAVGTEEDVVLT